MIRLFPGGIRLEDYSAMEKYHLQCKTADGDILIYLEALINSSKIMTFLMADDAQYCLANCIAVCTK